MRASLGQARNQSMVHPAIIPGNLLARSGNLAFAGDIHRTICKLLRTRSMKNFTRLSEESMKSGICFIAMGRNSDAIIINSSFGKRFDTSPVVKIEFTISINDSSLISASVKIKVIFCPT